MSYTKQYRITSKTNPDTVYTDIQDFWNDHNRTTKDVDKSSIWSSFDGKFKLNSVLDEGGKSVTRTIVFEDETAFNDYTTAVTNLFSTLGIVDNELNYTEI